MTLRPGPVLAEIRAELRAGRTSARRLAEEALSRARELSRLNAFLMLDDEGALAAADVADAERARGLDRGPLHGVPVAVKDNICTRGLRTTCASRILEHFVPPYDATAIARLRDAGAVILGKTNLDEFAMGSSNENSAFGAVRNPLDESRVPGGSSGGSVAAVAAGIVPLALGSETGGSVRQPAALCGVVGVKPSYGRVSRYGLVAFGSSLDQIGAVAADVAGAAALLHCISGADPLDSTSARTPVNDWSGELEQETRETGKPQPLRVGVVREYLGAVDVAMQHPALAPLREVPGIELREVSLPHTEYAVATYYVLASAEASANLARYDGMRYGLSVREPGMGLAEVYTASRSRGFGAEVKRRIMLGTFALSSGYYDAYYGKAQRARDAIAADFEAAFSDVDLVVCPTSPSTAFRLGEKLDDPLSMYLSDIFTIPANLAGIPAMSLPSGRDANGLPWGLQIMAPRFAESAMFRFARRVERALAGGSA